MKEPEAEFLRWGAMCEWLNSKGIKTCQIKNLKSEGKIRTHRIKTNGNGAKRAYYLKSQIKKDVLNEY